MEIGTGGGGPQMLYSPGGTLVPIGSSTVFREACNTWNRDSTPSLKNRSSYKVGNKRRRVLLGAKRVASPRSPWAFAPASQG